MYFNSVCLHYFTGRLLNSWRQQVLMGLWKEIWMPLLLAGAGLLACRAVGGSPPKDMQAEWMPMQIYWNSISSALHESIWHRTHSGVNVLLCSQRHQIQWMNNKSVTSRTVELFSLKGPTFAPLYWSGRYPRAHYTTGFVHLTCISITLQLIASHYLDYFVYPSCVMQLLFEGFGMQFGSQE